MNILVLGGAGFIGFHLVNRLKDLNHVTVVDDLSRGTLKDLVGVRFLWHDLTDPARVAAWYAEVMAKEWDQVYHLAAMVGVPNIEQAPLQTLQVNALAVLHTLKLKTKKFFLASTSEVYGRPEVIPTPESQPISISDILAPRAAYAASKIFAESLVANSGLPFVIGRFHNIYGPRMGWDHVIPKYCQQVIEHRNPLMVHHYGTRRAFCYIDDAVDAILLAMQHCENEVVNIGNDEEEIAMVGLMQRISRIGQHEAKIDETRLPEWIDRRCPDLTKLRARTGYKPLWTLNQGLSETYQWYKSHTLDHS